jgi:PQQ-like domain
MTNPLEVLWEIALPSWVSMPPKELGDAIVFRSGARLFAVTARDGATRWDLEVDPEGGKGSFVHVVADVTITDRKPNPERYTELVFVRDGRIEARVPTNCVVDWLGSAIAHGRLYVTGIAPEGAVVRAVDLVSRTGVVDAVVSGASSMVPVGERLLVVNGFGNPGMFWMAADGRVEDTVDARPMQQNIFAAAGRILVAAREGSADDLRRIMEVRELPSARTLWSASALGTTYTLDDNLAVFFVEGRGGRVLVAHDARTGARRWQSQVPFNEPGRMFLTDAFVGIVEDEGMSLLRRTDGTKVTEIEMGRSLVQIGDRIYVGGFRNLTCAAATQRGA